MKIKIELDTKNPTSAVIEIDGEVQSLVNHLWMDLEAGLIQDFRLRKRVPSLRSHFYIEELRGHKMVTPGGQATLVDQDVPEGTATIDDWHETTKFFHCGCYCEGLLVTHYDEEGVGQVEVAIWKRGDYHPPKSLRERLRWAWHIIWYGDIFKDQTVLTVEETRRLGCYLVELSDRIKK